MTSGGDAGASPDQALAAIASGRRREILRLLVAAESPITETELATHLASGDRRRATSPNTPAESPPIRTELRHDHLPHLATAGLIRWTPDDGTVETASHQALDDPRFRLLLDAEVDGLDEALAHLADEYHRIVLTVLRSADASMTQTDLARELVRSDYTDFDPGPDPVADVLSSLYHVHLPALDDDGLVAFDPDAGRVTDTDHPGLEAVVSIVSEPENHLVDRYDDFLQGLGGASETLHREASELAEWPELWGDFHHG